MISVNKLSALSVVLLLLASLFVVTTTPASVQAVDKPSVPQITVKLIYDPYDVPPTYTKNPYTGETITVPGSMPGYHLDRTRIIITIKNQPFTPSTNEQGYEYVLYYRSQFKGHFEDKWSLFKKTTFQSNSGYTTLEDSTVLEAGSQLDFRVQAVIGVGAGFDYVYYEDGKGPYLYGEVVCSDWSSVQTVTIEYEKPSTIQPSNTMPASPSDPLTSNSNTSPIYDPPPQNLLPTYLLITIATVCLITIPLVIIAYHYGQRKNKSYPNNPPNITVVNVFIVACNVIACYTQSCC